MDQYQIGEPVEVLSTFCADWASGFVIAEIVENGYRVRRIADQYVLPGVFPISAVRYVGRLLTV